MHEKYNAAITDAAARAVALAQGKGRILIGIAGAPGAGKSTFAADLTKHLGQGAIWVGMDGFHLANTELTRLGRSDARAPSTLLMPPVSSTWFNASPAGRRRSFTPQSFAERLMNQSLEQSLFPRVSAS